MTELLKAAEALIKRLEEMEKPLNDLAAFRTIHGMPYTGPNWGEPLAALRSAVDAAKRAGPSDTGSVFCNHLELLQGAYGFTVYCAFCAKERAAMAGEGKGKAE